MSDIQRRRPRAAAPHATGAARGGERERNVIRLARVRAARERILSGYYQRRDVRTSLARAVLAALRED